jgi:heat shock protein HslJ
MKRKSLFSQSLIYCLIAATVGIAIVNPLKAQHKSENHPSPLLMAQSSSLAGSWRLANMAILSTPTPMLPLPANEELTAEFSSGRISGSGGCNRFMGSYETQGEKLSVGQLASTFKACEESIMTQEFKYLKALQGAQRYEIDNQDQLTIYYQIDDESGVLRFVSKNVRGLW